MPLVIGAIFSFLSVSAVNVTRSMLGITIAMVSFRLIFAYLIKLLGLGLVSYVGIDLILTTYSQEIWSYLNFNSFGQNVAGIMRMDQVVSLWFSAFTMKIAMISFMKLKIGQQKLPL